MSELKVENGKLKVATQKYLRMCFCVALLSTFNFQLSTLSAQDAPKVSAKFDRDSIMIGDQFGLEVRVEKDMMQMVEFPVLTGGEMSENVEVVGEFPEDTVAQDGRRQTLSKRYVMTIFAEGDYNLGTFPVLYADKNIVDTLMSADSLRMRVATFDIDLEKDKPFDIKPPMGISLKFGEIGGWFALAVGILAALIFGIWFVIKYRKHIPFLAPKPVLPPHIVAIRQLEALRNQKLPQNDRHKQYYSAITDILREYIHGRFGISAMEMTSAEILDAVEEPRREGFIDDKRYGDLRDTLQTADLVKFAKWLPEEEQNEAAYYNAYYFVEETKPADPDGKPEEAEADPVRYNEK
jgi:hypothetical protein